MLAFIYFPNKENFFFFLEACSALSRFKKTKKPKKKNPTSLQIS